MFSLNIHKFNNIVDLFDIDHLKSMVIERIVNKKPFYKMLEKMAISDVKKISSDFQLKDGRWVQCQIINEPDNNCFVSGRQWIFKDVTEQKKAEISLEYNDYHDNLTKLPNKNSLKREIDSLIKAQNQFCFGLINLDEFNHVNNSMGHQAGDDLLIVISDKLNSYFSGDVLFGRESGDEFFFIVKNQENINYAKEICQSIIMDFQSPLFFKETKIHITASIGLTFIDNTSQILFNDVFNQADISVNRAKTLGKDNLVLFTQNMIDDSKKNLTMRHELIQALENKEFHLVYQPKINNFNGEMSGVEALIRWKKDGKIIPPGQFIPIAEDTGLIITITEWIIDHICSSLVDWVDYIPLNNNGSFKFHVAINISAKHFERDDLVSFIKACLDKYNLPPGLLELEITESSFIGNQKKVIKTLNELKKLGVSLAIDDFGTGYSSLSYLKDMPIDILKIDRSFICNMDESEQSSSFVNAIIQMAHVLNVEVVAEGVETYEVLDKLKDLNCDYTQGFLLSKPQEELDFFSSLQQIYLSTKL
jgi:diguanylate cyclase (GGDEF)-like protein